MLLPSYALHDVGWKSWQKRASREYFVKHNRQSRNSFNWKNRFTEVAYIPGYLKAISVARWVSSGTWKIFCSQEELSWWRVGETLPSKNVLLLLWQLKNEIGSHLLLWNGTEPSQLLLFRNGALNLISFTNARMREKMWI